MDTNIKETVQERYGLRAAAIAVYPMYRGIGRLVGMDVVGPPATIDEQQCCLESKTVCWRLKVKPKVRTA